MVRQEVLSCSFCDSCASLYAHPQNHVRVVAVFAFGDAGTGV